MATNTSTVFWISWRCGFGLQRREAGPEPRGSNGSVCPECPILNEFELISRYFTGLGPAQPGLMLGIGDDCSVLRVPPDSDLCQSIDTMVEGVHFATGAPPEKVAWRALAAALSDLAAMGAVPAGFLLALTLPGADSRWLERFGQGLSRACDHFAVALIGGDTTRGPLCITVQVNGYVDRGKALCRGGAREGDRVLVSGTLGDAGAALSLLSRADASLSEAEHQLLARYYFPEPRLVLGRALIGHAHAAMDISDGLLADAEHMAGASGVSIELDVGALPLSGALRQCQPDIARQLALTAGDDYELLVSMSEAAWADFQLRPESGLLTPIGRVHTGAGVFLSSGGVPVAAPLKKGYRHFD